MDEPSASPMDVWLWPEGEGVRWWSLDQTCLLAESHPTVGRAAPSIKALRDQGACWTLKAALAPDLGGRLGEALGQHLRVRMYLHRDLGPSWHALPFEWLRHEGEELHGKLSIARYWSPGDPTVEPIARGRWFYVFNLLPRSDPVQPARGLGSAPRTQVVDGPGAVSLFLAGSELANLAALCVLAHGSEDDEAAPFLLPNGAPWSLPAERGLPPLVILLACGDDDGNLIDEAKRLIGAGAKTVLAPLGRPTLDGAAHFLPEFLARWRAGERVDDALCRLAGDPVGEFGARRLLLLGEGELRLDDVPRREEWEDKRLAEAAWGGDAAALMTLLQRLTRRCAMAGQDIDEAEAELRSLFGINPRDEEAERHLLSLLDSVQRQSPHLVRAWILPLLARLSEAYAQDRIHSLGDERLELERRGVPVTAPILHYWSRLYYRLGLYGLALRDLARGLSLLDRANPCARGAGLLGQIVNVLIDLDLPQEAKVCLEGLDDCLANRGDADARWQRHLSKDRQARIALRLGRPRAALALYRRKRDEAVSEEGADTRGAGVRELAGLLYVAAWLEPDGPDEAAEWQSWSIEALAILESCRSRGETIGYGNFDPMYLFRACALWGWRRGDTASLDMVMAHRALLRERLFAAGKADPGPPGFCFSYLTLAERDGLLVNPDIPSWDEIAVSLAGHGYYIELAALAHLHGRPSDAHDYLDRFQAQRSLAPGVAFPPWFHEGLLADWGGVIEARAVHERRVLNDVASSDVAGLVESGLLPF